MFKMFPDMHDWYGMTIEQIQEQLNELPLVSEEVRRECSFTGSGMTEHGFMVGSGDFWCTDEDKYELYDGIKVYCARPAKSEAEIIYNSINRWDRDGKARDIK